MELRTQDYRIGFGAQSAFIGAWLKKNWLGKKNRQRFLIYAGIIFVMMLLNMHAPKIQTGSVIVTPMSFYIFMAIGSLIAGIVFSAILTFIVSPSFVWLWQIVTYLFGPLRKRTQNLRATDEYLIKEVGGVESNLAWKDVFEVADTKSTLLVFTNANCALIVPKSAFDTPEAAQTFSAFAQTRWIDAKSVF